MLEQSIAAVVIALVVWDAFRRYLAVVKWNKYMLDKFDTLTKRLDTHYELVEKLEKKVNQTATDLGAISISDMNRRNR